jgi:hypothetical protein
MFVQLRFWPSGHYLFNISYRSRGWVSFAVCVCISICIYIYTTCKYRTLWRIYILGCIKSSVVQYTKMLYLCSGCLDAQLVQYVSYTELSSLLSLRHAVVT